ncbi:unnamed protein product [Ectocarpus sp. 6 AP-2014]
MPPAGCGRRLKEWQGVGTHEARPLHRRKYFGKTLETHGASPQRASAEIISCLRTWSDGGKTRPVSSAFSDSGIRPVTQVGGETDQGRP